MLFISLRNGQEVPVVSSWEGNCEQSLEIRLECKHMCMWDAMRPWRSQAVGTRSQYLQASVCTVRDFGNSKFKPGLPGSWEGIFAQKLVYKVLYKRFVSLIYKSQIFSHKVCRPLFVLLPEALKKIATGLMVKTKERYFSGELEVYLITLYDTNYTVMTSMKWLKIQNRK